MSQPVKLDRRQVVASLLEEREDLLVVAGLGGACFDLMAAGDHEFNYYLWAAMGSGAMVGLGLAASNPQRPVLVLTGDGEILMGLGALATIAVQRPDNLTVAVLDNAHYGETGMQRSHTAQGVSLVDVAAGCGFSCSQRVTTMSEVVTLRKQMSNRSGPRFASIEIEADTHPRVLPPRDGVFVKHRFRMALGHAAP